ncbi:branched-chain amino acid aminotransferase [Bacteroidota bacterium]
MKPIKNDKLVSDILNIQIERAAETRIRDVDFNNIQFGSKFSDHMFVADYSDGEWKSFKIMPYGKMSFTPACMALHYGQTIFEGLKAYRNDEGKVMVFRPEANFKRLNKSAERMCMPTMPEEVMMEGLKQLLKIDAAWVPNRKDSALYIRPFMFATDEYIGVRPSSTYRCIIFTGPVGPYYSDPLKVLVQEGFSRAAPGGTGSAKSGGNYGGALYPTKLAHEAGYHQLLWTDAIEHKYIEESGTMNVMFQIDDVLVTPPTGDTILSGITRDSVLKLAVDMGVRIEERKIHVDEIIAAFKSGALKDAFGVGTAATVAPIKVIGYKGIDMELPDLESRTISAAIAKRLAAIRYGEVKDPYGWMVNMG